MEEVEIIIIYEAKDKNVVETFKKDLVEKMGSRTTIKLSELSFGKKEDVLTEGRDLAERYFNATVGLNYLATFEKQEASGLAFTPEWFITSSGKKVDERSLAECYVYSKIYELNDFPAVIANNTVVATGKLPSIDEVASKIIDTENMEPPTLSGGEKGGIKVLIKEEQEAIQNQAEPLRVHLAQEQPVTAGMNTTVEEQLPNSKTENSIEQTTKTRITEILKRTGFRGPEECTECLYFIDSENRCGLLHITIFDVKRPVCRMNFS
ncbi:MAG: hypothetical protein QW688_03960 [Thermoprotei archaeon]